MFTIRSNAQALFLLATVMGASTHGAHAQQSVSLAGGKVAMTVPAGLKPMSATLLKVKYPSANRPQQAWSNARASISIATTYNQKAQVRPVDLPKVRPFLQKFLGGARPDVKFTKNEMVKLGGAPWVHLEFTSKAVDTQVYNDLYFTSVNNHLFGVTFNSTVAQKKAALPLFQRAKGSIRVRG